MRTTVEILGHYKDAMKRRFMALAHRRADPAPDILVPDDPTEAMRLGIAMGRREGYGEGLVDGTQLGFDVGMDTVDELLSQPVIFGSPGDA